MRLILLLSLCVSVLAVAPSCDLSKSSQAVCDDFCNYRCGIYNSSAGDTGAIQNVSIYRLTPTNVTGIRNKDTGDAPGDIGYWLSKKNLTAECAKHPEEHGCLTDGQNLYGLFTVETDGQYGPYLQCNPTNKGGPDPIFSPIWKDSREFQCGMNCLLPTDTGCHSYDPSPPKNKTDDNWGLECYCDGTKRHRKSLGRSSPQFLSGGWGKVPASWAPQCKDGYTSVDPKKYGCLTGKVYKTLQGWSFDSTLALACESCRKDADCSGWATKDNRTVELFKGNVTATAGACVSAVAEMGPYGKQTSWYGVGALGGMWYSTPLAGECPKGMPMGTAGCTWREVASVYKNASCVDHRVDVAVEAFGAACFSACGKPLNRTSDCYLDCYRNLLMGNAGINITRIPKEKIIEPWVRAFDDPQAGGCPDVVPAACHGSQCDPLVGYEHPQAPMLVV